MGFINNHTDNFLPSSNPWEKDTTLYSVPQKPLKEDDGSYSRDKEKR